MRRRRTTTNGLGVRRRLGLTRRRGSGRRVSDRCLIGDRFRGIWNVGLGRGTESRRWLRKVERWKQGRSGERIGWLVEDWSSIEKRRLAVWKAKGERRLRSLELDGGVKAVPRHRCGAPVGSKVWVFFIEDPTDGFFHYVVQ